MKNEFLFIPRRNEFDEKNEFDEMKRKIQKTKTNAPENNFPKEKRIVIVYTVNETV